MSTTQVAVDRPPRTDRELYHWVRAVWGVTIPNTQVCPNHVPPFRVFADAYFARYPTIILKGSRGLAGKSWTLAALANTMAVGLNAQVTILGGSGAQSLNVHNASKLMWEYHNAPSHLITGEPTKFDTTLESKAWIHSLMASQRSARGPHPQRLILDEIDEMDLDILEAAQGQTMVGKQGLQKGIETCTVMSSTHQYANGTMTEMLERAKDPERGWKVYEVCYRENTNPIDGWLTQDEVERKKREIAKLMWETEYELGEPSIEGRAIDGDAVERCFTGPVDETENWIDPTIVAILVEAEEAERTRRPGYRRPVLKFVTGVDWAKEQDKTVVTTFLIEPNGIWRCVAWSTFNRQPWPTMVAKAEERLRRYGGGFAHDATGLGNVISDYFDPDLRRRYNRVFADYVMGSGRARMDLFSNYISAIENGSISYPRISAAYRDHKYVTWDDLFGSGHPPDSVVAGAIAWHLRSKMVGTSIPAPLGMTKAPSGLYTP